jgi:hypothetical protein
MVTFLAQSKISKGNLDSAIIGTLPESLFSKSLEENVIPQGKGMIAIIDQLIHDIRHELIEVVNIAATIEVLDSIAAVIKYSPVIAIFD